MLVHSHLLAQTRHQFKTKVSFQATCKHPNTQSELQVLEGCMCTPVCTHVCLPARVYACALVHMHAYTIPSKPCALAVCSTLHFISRTQQAPVPRPCAAGSCTSAAYSRLLYLSRIQQAPVPQPCAAHQHTPCLSCVQHAPVPELCAARPDQSLW